MQLDFQPKKDATGSTGFWMGIIDTGGLKKRDVTTSEQGDLGALAVTVKEPPLENESIIKTRLEILTKRAYLDVAKFGVAGVACIGAMVTAAPFVVSAPIGCIAAYCYYRTMCSIVAVKEAEDDLIEPEE